MRKQQVVFIVFLQCYVLNALQSQYIQNKLHKSVFDSSKSYKEIHPFVKRIRDGLQTISQNNENDIQDQNISFLQLNPLAAAKASIGFSSPKNCVMCEYILEMVDRRIKSLPRWTANNLSNEVLGGQQEGPWRNYPGAFFQASEGLHQQPVGSGIGEVYGGNPSTNNTPDLKQGQQSSTTDEKTDPEDTNIMENNNSNDNTIRDTKLPLHVEGSRRHIKGKSTSLDFAYLEDLEDKDTEFSQMFNDVMDALDDICQNMPPSYKNTCHFPYLNGLTLVEMYLHDYDDWEICIAVKSCTQTLFHA